MIHAWWNEGLISIRLLFAISSLAHTTSAKCKDDGFVNPKHCITEMWPFSFRGFFLEAFPTKKKLNRSRPTSCRKKVCQC